MYHTEDLDACVSYRRPKINVVEKTGQSQKKNNKKKTGQSQNLDIIKIYTFGLNSDVYHCGDLDRSVSYSRLKT